MSTRDLKVSTVSTNTPLETPKRPIKLNEFGNTRPLDKVQAEPTPRKA